MTDTPELVLEVLNALIALVVLYLGLRIVAATRLALRRRSMYLFITAAVLFALQEALGVVAAAPLRWGLLGLLREMVETAFIVSLVAAMVFVVRSETQEMPVLHLSAETDPLTKLYNMALFRRAATPRFRQAKVQRLPLALIMFDIDDFKTYNDVFGHEAGNGALQAVAQTLQEIARSEDLAARYGGDEFVVLLGATHEAAAAVAERIRSGIASQCALEHNPSLHRPITVSIGVATLTASMTRLEELIEAADRALYCAKRAGKNRVSARLSDAGPGIAAPALARDALRGLSLPNTASHGPARPTPWPLDASASPDVVARGAWRRKDRWR